VTARVRTRRTAAFAGAALLLATGLAAAPARAQTTAFVLGSGSASAVVTKTKIFYAGYSLQVPIGLSATSYENKQSRALGGAYDVSAVVGLVAEKPEQVSPISIDSNKGDAAKTVDVGAGPILGRIALTARAVPSSRSDVRLADVNAAGVLRVEGGRSWSTTAVVDGKERRAQSSVSVAAVTLAGGLVELEGLRWDAIHRGGAAKQADATFSLGRLRVGGVTVARDIHDLDPVLAAVNTLLAPTGLVVEGPQVVHRATGAIDVTPMRIGVINSPLGAEHVGPIIAQLRPQLLPVFEALTNADTTLGLAALVADLGLGVADGSGGIEFSIGGATALTDDKVFANPFDGLNVAPPALAPGDVATPPTLAALPRLPESIPGSAGGTKQLASSKGVIRCVLAGGAKRNGDCRGSNVPGAIAIVGLVVAAMLTYETYLRRRRDAVAAAVSR